MRELERERARQSGRIHIYIEREGESDRKYILRAKMRGR